MRLPSPIDFLEGVAALIGHLLEPLSGSLQASQRRPSYRGMASRPEKMEAPVAPLEPAMMPLPSKPKPRPRTKAPSALDLGVFIDPLGCGPGG